MRPQASHWRSGKHIQVHHMLTSELGDAGGTVLEDKVLKVAYDAQKDGWSAVAFHKKVRSCTV